MGEVIPKQQTANAPSGGSASTPGAGGLTDTLTDPLLGPAVAGPGTQTAGKPAPVGSYQPRFDTSWIDNLRDDVRENIDGGYAREEALAKVPRVVEIDGRIKAAVKKHGPKSQQVKDLRAERAQLVASLTPAEIDAVKVGKVGKQEHGESNDDRIFTGELAAGEGRAIVRDNLVGTLEGLLGSPEAVEKWMANIQPADVPGSPLLHTMAKSRLERARSAFENKFDVKFLSSTVAFAMRGRQNVRQGKGMLSHATGMAIDYKAYDNPHLKDWQRRVMLETVSGGSSRLRLKDAKGDELGYGDRRKMIIQLGKDTVGGQAHSADGQSFIQERFDASFNEHARTEIDFRAALDAQGDGADDDVARFRGLAERYWEVQGDIQAASALVDTRHKAYDKAKKGAVDRIKKTRLKELDKQIADARSSTGTAAAQEGQKLSGKQIDAAAPVKRLLDERAALQKRGPDAAAIEADATVAAAREAWETAKKSLVALQAPWLAELNQIIAPWLKKFDDRIAGYKSTIAANPDVPEATLVKEVTAAVERARKGRNAAAALAELRANPRFAPVLAGLADDVLTDPRRLREHLKQVSAKVQSIHAAKESLVALEQVRATMTSDLAFSLGSGSRNPKTGAMEAKHTVADPSALQFLEVGTVFNGGAAPKKQAAEGAEAAAPAQQELAGHEYFREFTRTMIEHGFEAGGAWDSADTMHFELAEGMDHFQNSTKDTTYGPKGKVTKAPPKEKVAKASKPPP